MTEVSLNRGRRKLVAGALNFSIAASVSAASSNVSSEAASKFLAMQIGNLGVGAARTNATPAIVQLGDGMGACIAKVNAQGGVRGRKIAFEQVSDQGDSGRFIDLFKQTQGQRALAVLCPFGGDNIGRLLKEKVLDGEGPAVIGAIPGADVFRNPGHPKLLHVRARDGRQIARILSHAQELGSRQVAMFVVNNDAGRSGVTEARAVAGTVNAMTVTGFESDADPASIVSKARALAKTAPDCVVVLGPPRFMADAVLALREASFKKFVYALSYLSPELLVSVAKEHAANVVISQVLPNPSGITMQLQQEFQAAMRKHLPTQPFFSTFHLEGYVCALVFVEGLRRTQSLDGASLAKTLRTANEMDFGGFPVDFSKGNEGSRFVDIAMVHQNGRLRY